MKDDKIDKGWMIEKKTGRRSAPGKGAKEPKNGRKKRKDP